MDRECRDGGRVAYEVDRELNAETLAFADDELGEVISLQRSLVFDEQDKRLGHDTHCLVLADGRCEYGAVQAVSSFEGHIVLHLTADGARSLGLEDELALPLPTTDVGWATEKAEALTRVASGEG